MKIIVYTPEYREWTGGIIVMHKLAQILKELNFNVYFCPQNSIWCSPYKLPITNKADKDDIVIYPESVKGNPLNVEKYARYMLQSSHVRDGFLLYYSEKWWKLSQAPYLPVTEKNILFIIDSKYEFFYDMKKERSGDCFTHRKGKNTNFIHRKGAIEIKRGASNEYLRDVFNRCERFISYDFNSFLSTQAAMCGCTSIVSECEGGSQELLDSGYPFGALGVSYGLENIEWAKFTAKQLRNLFSRFEVNQPDRVKLMLLKIFKCFNVSGAMYEN